MSQAAYAIAARKPGPPQELVEIPLTLPEPGPGEVLIRHSAIGVNFIDCYYRSGLYPWPVGENLVLGSEAAGTISALGPGIGGLRIGDRVAYTLPNNAYATHRVIDARHLVPIPSGISDEIAAAIMLKGLTARYLLKDSYPVKAGQKMLFHAAAGGVGLIAGQWLKALGAHAIGTAGGAEKCVLASKNGFADMIDYTAADFQQAARQKIPEGFDVVYDSVGKNTLPRSLKCLRPHGTLVNFGQSSGLVTDFKISDLAAGSFHLTRPVLFHFTANRQWLLNAADELFRMILDGKLTINIHRRAALREAASVHVALESRKTTGSIILIP